MLKCSRAEIAARGLNIACTGPPGLTPEVDALMDRAKIGVVCGAEDGAPAVLTEYMLAGLPVLADEALVCGLQFIVPKWIAASVTGFSQGIQAVLARAPHLSPRDREKWPRLVR